MKTKLEENLASASASMRMTASKALKHSISSILSLCVVAGIAATIASFSQTSNNERDPSEERTLTSKTGTSTKFRLACC